MGRPAGQRQSGPLALPLRATAAVPARLLHVEVCAVAHRLACQPIRACGRPRSVCGRLKPQECIATLLRALWSSQHRRHEATPPADPPAWAFCPPPKAACKNAPR